jgi:hypothetical protein
MEYKQISYLDNNNRRLPLNISHKFDQFNLSKSFIDKDWRIQDKSFGDFVDFINNVISANRNDLQINFDKTESGIYCSNDEMSLSFIRLIKMIFMGNSSCLLKNLEDDFACLPSRLSHSGKKTQRIFFVLYDSVCFKYFINF